MITLNRIVKKRSGIGCFKEDIDKALEKYPDFREELFDKIFLLVNTLLITILFFRFITKT